MSRDSRSARGIFPVLFAGLLCGLFGSNARGQTPSLKDTYKNDFLIGVALGGTLPDDYSPAELAVIKSQFNAVTPGTSPVVMREVEDRSVYEPPR